MNHLESELNSYFDELLSDATVAEVPKKIPSPAPPAVATKVQPSAVKPKIQEHADLEIKKKQQLQALLNQQIAVAKVNTELEPAIKTEPIPIAAPPPKVRSPELLVEPVVSPDEPESDLAVQNEASHLDEEQIRWCENGRPPWAQQRFDALLFEVAGLKLAVPLISLGQIVPISGDLKHLFGQSPWFMGVLHTQLGALRVVNTSLFVMPERYDASFVDGAAYAISLHGVPWALAVNSVTQPITLDPDDIKWRTSRSSRPWLAGTVKSAMCALLDIPRMARVLTESDPSLK